MTWLVDAQLPRRLAERLAKRGHDVIHTFDLPDANRTTDSEINRLAKEQGRIVITKDSDFVDSHLLSGMPPRLLWVTTGNIANNALLSIFENNLSNLEAAFASSDFVELSRDGMTIH